MGKAEDPFTGPYIKKGNRTEIASDSIPSESDTIKSESLTRNVETVATPDDRGYSPAGSTTLLDSKNEKDKKVSDTIKISPLYTDNKPDRVIVRGRIIDGKEKR